jgi:Pyridoxamine 5'-phosphate oxidase
MARAYDAISDELTEFIADQHVFFVATAPSGESGHVNLSPKGLDTFAVIDATTVAYLDLTGSGVETIAHLRDNGRITIMFCAFDGKPLIVRLYGRGEVLSVGEPDADALLPRFGSYPGARSVIRVRVNRVSTSCGYGVPLLQYEAERDRLLAFAERRGEQGLLEYRAEKNAASIDGLPGLDANGR